MARAIRLRLLYRLGETGILTPTSRQATEMARVFPQRAVGLSNAAKKRRQARCEFWELAAWRCSARGESRAE